MKRKFTLNLIDNAKDSLRHAVVHLTENQNLDVGDYKRAILDVAHVVELILKEKLQRLHPAFIWSRVDDYPDISKRTVNTTVAIFRLQRFLKIKFTEEQQSAVNACRKIRNLIEHYECEFHEREARFIIGRMLAFIFTFASEYLEIDFKDDFKKDDTWEALLDMQEFWLEHGRDIEKKLQENGVPTCECPACIAETFDLRELKCHLCDHREYEVGCDYCGETVWASTTEVIEGEPELGVKPDESKTICETCLFGGEEVDRMIYELYGQPE